MSSSTSWSRACARASRSIFRPIATIVDPAAFAASRAAHPRALGAPRQATRFLCRLSSPALTREKLSRHPSFGALEGYPFAEVLAFYT